MTSPAGAVDGVLLDDELGAPPPAAGLLTRWGRQVTVFKVVSVAVAVTLAVLAIYPILRVVLELFVSDGRIDVSPLRDLFALDDLWKLLGTTLLIVVVSAALALVVASALAYLNERTDARLGVVGDALPLLPFLLPAIAGAVGWVLLLSPRSGFLNAWIRAGLDLFGVNLEEGPFDIYSWYGIIFTYTLYQVPYAYLMISAGLRNIDPALEEQSRVSGAGLFRTIRKVTLPAIKPSIGGALLLMCWCGTAMFSVPVIIGRGAEIEVVSVRIVNLINFTFPPRVDLAVGLSLFVLLFVGSAYAMQRRILRRGHFATIGGRASHAAPPLALGKWRWPARALMLGYVGVATVLPVVALSIVALNGFWTTNITWDDLSLETIRATLFDDENTRDALNNSLYLAGVGATIGIVAAALVSLFVRRSDNVLGRLVDRLIKVPAVISHTVIAVGFILAFAGPPFRLSGTIVILLLAYVVIYMPQASVASDAAASQVGAQLTEASQVCGAGGGRTFLRVNLPLMLPGLVAGWALLFVCMVGDLTASAILSGTGNNVVGFRILEVFYNGSYAALASLAITLTLITSGVLVLVLVVTRRFGYSGTSVVARGS